LKGAVVPERHRDAAHWARYVETLKAPDGIVHRNVEGRVVCVDPKRQWRRYTNIRHNALILSALYAFSQLAHRKAGSHERRRGGSLE
jgi:hypothetical protein